MVPEQSFLSTLLAAVVGLVISVLLEQRCDPVPRRLRPLAAWGLHVGVLLINFCGLTLLLGRPWFAMAETVAVFLLLVLVNNAKVHSLREAFVVQDFEYFTDAIRHPRLYIPFLGWWRFLAAVIGFAVAVGIGLWVEPVPAARLSLAGQGGALLLLLCVALIGLVHGTRSDMPVTLEPNHDLQQLGLVASLWRYGMALRRRPEVVSPFASGAGTEDPPVLPHLVAVQSESFFDPRDLYDGIRDEVMAEFDRLKREARQQGRLQVPAWGANTVRTECAFLTGIESEALGVHRFNPYRAIAAGWHPGSVAACLRQLGYRTVCVHPYPASFYQRDRVYPSLGFDQFIDIGAFSDQDRHGPYIGDVAVAEKVSELLRSSKTPLFVFVITMENHGPLHLEKVEAGDVERLYTRPPPAGCDDLTIYLRHLRNANRMIGILRETLSGLERPASLCWYGDHVPIMPAVYNSCGTPAGEVDYLIWSNGAQGDGGRSTPLTAAGLGLAWLALERLVVPPEREETEVVA